MAKMYPKNIELYNATASEKKVYRALENQLGNEYTVFYSVQWVDQIDGDRKESECDFLIFNEQLGFLTCEVKGGRQLKKENSKFILVEGDSERELRRSPMEQAEESSRYFYRLYSKEYNSQFNGVYGSVSLFPFYAVDDPVLLDHRPKEIVLDVNDMENLGMKIYRAFLFYRGQRTYLGSLTKTQRDNFKNMINKKIASKASAGSIIEQKEFELNNVNRIQDNLVYFLSYYDRTFISGGAGTGKTWIAYKFAKLASLNDKDVLVTVNSKHLAIMLQELLKDYVNVEVLTLDELIERDGVSKKALSEDTLLLYDNKKYVKYDTIIVDEAQDFDQYEAMIISIHLKTDNSELRVFYDQTQNIFDKDFKDGFPIQYPPFLLRENLRNTSSIYDWATRETNLGKEVITNQIIGPMPETYNFNKKYDLKKYLESEIQKLVDKENIPLEAIVVLVDHDNIDLKDSCISRWECSDKAEKNKIRISLVENFKGLESEIIFYVHSITTPEKYNYVAYTRAKFYLYELISKR